MNDTISGSNVLYPEDLFYVHVLSASIPPALPYVERTQGQASIFTGYRIGAVNYTFTITNSNGKFSKRNSWKFAVMIVRCLSQVLRQIIEYRPRISQQV